MAHFIKLHTLEGSEMLFNLDVVVSIDPLPDGTMVQTRWGGTKVKEDIDKILSLSSPTATPTGHQLLMEKDDLPY
tara:strand:+ start:857 stop:1081 length:225 start_codon:yes stop_codon:yes gene_type:complete